MYDIHYWEVEARGKEAAVSLEIDPIDAEETNNEAQEAQLEKEVKND